MIQLKSTLVLTKILFGNKFITTNKMLGRNKIWNQQTCFQVPAMSLNCVTLEKIAYFV